MKFGNRGSKAAAERWRVLTILAEANGTQLDSAEVVERGWPAECAANPHGNLYSGERDPGWDARCVWHRLAFAAVPAALRWLRARDLAASIQPYGYCKKWWQITPEGAAVYAGERDDLEASVLADLAALPVTESAP